MDKHPDSPTPPPGTNPSVFQAESERPGDPSTARTTQVQLQRRAVRGSVVSLANQTIKTTINLTTPLVLALYLDPKDFGLVGIALSVQSFIIVLRDGGLANSLIQRKDATDRHFNSVFWLSGMAALALGGILAVAAPSIARFYDQPRLAWILWLLALPILAQGLCSALDSRFRKELRFGRILLADSGSAVVASAVAIAAAILGAGIWALVLRAIVTPVLFSAACWSLSPWRPRLEFSWGAIRALWSFGGYLFLTTLLAFGMTQLDVPIVGKLVGMGAAGAFFVARTLALTTVSQIAGAVSQVMFPVFSALQDDLATIRSGFLTGTRCLATLIFPFMAALISLSPDVIPMLGDRWRPAVPLIQVIALQGLFVCLNGPASQVLYARGRSRLQFTYSVVIAVFVIASFVVGCRWGVLGVAVAWTSVRFCLAPTVLWFASREIEMPVTAALVNVWRPAVAAVGAGLAARLVVWIWLTMERPVGYVLVSIELLIGFAVYAGLCRWLLKDTLRKIKDDFLATGLAKRFYERAKSADDIEMP